MYQNFKPAVMPALPDTAPTGVSWLTGASDLLTTGLSAWAQVEAIKAGKNQTGQGRIEQSLVPEYENGAAVQVEAPKLLPGQAAKVAQSENKVFGVDQKTALMFAGVLALVLIAKRL